MPAPRQHLSKTAQCRLRMTNHTPTGTTGYRHVKTNNRCPELPSQRFPLENAFPVGLKPRQWKLCTTAIQADTLTAVAPMCESRAVFWCVAVSCFVVCFCGVLAASPEPVVLRLTAVLTIGDTRRNRAVRSDLQTSSDLKFNAARRRLHKRSKPQNQHNRKILLYLPCQYRRTTNIVPTLFLEVSTSRYLSRLPARVSQLLALCSTAWMPLFWLCKCPRQFRFPH